MGACAAGGCSSHGAPICCCTIFCLRNASSQSDCHISILYKSRHLITSPSGPCRETGNVDQGHNVISHNPQQRRRHSEVVHGAYVPCFSSQNSNLRTWMLSLREIPVSGPVNIYGRWAISRNVGASRVASSDKGIESVCPELVDNFMVHEDR